MGIFKRGDDKGDQWKANTPPRLQAEPREPRQSASNRNEVIAENIGTLMERVSLNSVQEIDRLIDDLERLKARLASEAERVQREVVGYASLSQSAMQSTKIITESLSHWRKPPQSAPHPVPHTADAPNVSEEA
jgi:hypothetical protein